VGRSSNPQKDLIALLSPSQSMRVLCINVEALRTPKVHTLVSKLLESGRFKLLVDESTIIKNSTATQSRRCLSLSKLAAYTRILSGEPAPNGPMDLYHQYKFLSPHVLPGFTKDKFMLAFCQIETRHFGGRKITQAGKAFTPHGQQMFEQMVGHCTFRLRKADVNDTVKFPAIENQIIKVAMTAEQRKLYNEVLVNVQTELREILGTEGTIRANVIISRLIKLHQITSGFVGLEDETIHTMTDNPKLDALRGLMAGRIGKGTIIWCHYRHDVDTVTAALEAMHPGHVARIYGGISDNERITSLQRFMAGEREWLAANPASIGHGLTLTAADMSVYYSRHYNYEHKVQSRDRIHRIGQLADTVYYPEIVMADSIDEQIILALDHKQGFCQSLFKSEWIQRVLGIPAAAVIMEPEAEDSWSAAICSAERILAMGAAINEIEKNGGIA
jgi:SNF2 family DNA or RNA helicase